jgi:hypothetical protein
MSWYKSGSDTFGFRTAIAVDGTGLAPGITEVNVTVTIPSDHARFWDNVQSDGDDVRFTQSDGTTVLAYERTTWDYANRSALFKVTAFTVGLAANMGNLWMFFGNSTIASGSTAYGGGTLYTGRIITSGVAANDLVVEPGSVPGETSARYDLQKTPAESVFVWVRPLLTTRDVLFNGYFFAEEVQFVTISADDAKVTATMPNMRLFTDSRGFALIRVLISGGADTETDTVRITVTTTNSRIGQALIDVTVKTL